MNDSAKMQSIFGVDWWNEYVAFAAQESFSQFLLRIGRTNEWTSILSKGASDRYSEIEGFELINYYILMRSVPLTRRKIKVYTLLRLNQIASVYPQLAKRLNSSSEIDTFNTKLSLSSFNTWSLTPPEKEDQTMVVEFTIPEQMPIATVYNIERKQYEIFTWPNLKFNAEINSTIKLSYAGFDHSTPQYFFYNQLSTDKAKEYVNYFVTEQYKYYLGLHPEYTIILTLNSQTILVMNDNVVQELQNHALLTTWIQGDSNNRRIVPLSGVDELLKQWNSIPQYVRVNFKLIGLLRITPPEILAQVNAYKANKWYMTAQTPIEYIDANFTQRMLTATETIFLKLQSRDYFIRLTPSELFPNAIQSELNYFDNTQDIDIYHEYASEMIFSVPIQGISVSSDDSISVVKPMRFITCPCPNQPMIKNYAIYISPKNTRYIYGADALNENQKQLSPEVIADLKTRVIKIIERHLRDGINIYRYNLENLLFYVESNKREAYFLETGPTYNPKSPDMMQLTSQDIRMGVHPRFNNHWTIMGQYYRLLQEFKVPPNPKFSFLARFDQNERFQQILELLDEFSETLFIEQELAVSYPASSENLHDVLIDFYDRGANLLQLPTNTSMKEINSQITKNILRVDIFNLVFSFVPRVSAAWTNLIQEMIFIYSQDAVYKEIIRDTDPVYNQASAEMPEPEFYFAEGGSSSPRFYSVYDDNNPFESNTSPFDSNTLPIEPSLGSTQSMAPAPVTQSMAPAPVTQSMAPVPVSQSMAPAPVSQSMASTFTPAPVTQSMALAPVSQSMAPAPVTQSMASTFTPAPVTQSMALAPVSQSMAPAPVTQSMVSNPALSPTQSRAPAPVTQSMVSNPALSPTQSRAPSLTPSPTQLSTPNSMMVTSPEPVRPNKVQLRVLPENDPRAAAARAAERRMRQESTPPPLSPVRSPRLLSSNSNESSTLMYSSSNESPTNNTVFRF